MFNQMQIMQSQQDADAVIKELASLYNNNFTNETTDIIYEALERAGVYWDTMMYYDQERIVDFFNAKFN